MKLMKSRLVTLILVCGVSALVEANEWRDRWMSEMDAIQNTPLEHQRERLGAAARAKSKAGGWTPTADQEAVADRAIQMLIAIPGHAEYYRDKILAAQEDVKGHLDDPQISIRLVKYYNERMYGFQILEHLPSVENVKVLGELLSNEWTGELTIQKGSKVFPLSHDAVGSLGSLTLLEKPFPVTEGYQISEQLEGWRQWYQEIKDGKRTFRFEGDPTDYDLNGPAPKEKLERIALAAKRDDERLGRQHGKADAAQSPLVLPPAQTPLLALILAGFAVLGSLAWYFHKSSRA